MAPMAAAAAIAAVAAGLLVANDSTSVRKPHAAPAALPTVQPAPRLADGLPAYFLAVPEREVTGRGAPTGSVDIVSTATGRTAVRVRLPGSVTHIAADSTGLYYAAVLPSRGPARFYRIAWPVNGGQAAVAALPIHAPSGRIGYLAVSPDGTELAIATYVQHGSTGFVQNLMVASTTTGAERHWSTPPSDSTGSMAGISWLADNRTLAFSWGYLGSAKGSLRTLGTAGPGADLLAGRSVLPLTNQAGKFGDFVISKDGRGLIGVSEFPSGPFGVVRGQPTALGDVVRFSARTGLASFLYRPGAQRASHTVTMCDDPMWVSPSGRQALLTCVTSSPAGQHPARVLLLGRTGAVRLRQLEPVANDDQVAFGS
jgi:hypothetical protein